jgi:hypothetical protein
MPEAGKHAPVLIAISHQARERQRASGDPLTLRANCTIIIVFAAFYIEATINAIIDQMNMRPKMEAFLNPDNRQHYHPGMQAKLAWFYNEFVATKKAANKVELGTMKIYDQLESRFPGYAEIRDFRNGVSHGKIGSAADELDEAIMLREQAKDIRTELFAIGKSHDPNVDQDTTYWDAIA